MNYLRSMILIIKTRVDYTIFVSNNKTLIYINFYIRCIKNLKTVEYFESKTFFRKMFQTKVVGFKKIYSLITFI